MFWEKRGPGSSSSRRRAAYRPDSESLEERRLMATNFDLGTIQSANRGTEVVGAANNNGAGYTVSDVGDVTGSGFDSYVVAAPSVTTFSASGIPVGTTNSAVYLIFGTKAVNATNATGVAALLAGQRAGDLGTLGTLGVAGSTGQLNPTVTQPLAPNPTVAGFNYDGLKLVTGLNATTGLGNNSQLGYSVAALGDINGDGYSDFMIGAPNDDTGGRAFIIYGGPQLANQTNKTIDLEPTPGTISTTFPTKLVSFYSTTATVTDKIGYAVAGIGNFFALGGSGLGNSNDIAIGDPIVNGTGAVYAISGVRVNNLATGANVDLTTVGAAGGIGEVFTGVTAGDYTGASIANAGNFDGSTNGTVPVSSLLIGAPGLPGSAGRAYLIYGNQITNTNLALGTTMSLSSVGVTPVTTPTPTFPLSGDVFLGSAVGGRLGFSVSSATDFNADGLNDILIGAPGSGTGTSGPGATGFVTVVYGRGNTAGGIATTNRPNGPYTLSPNTTTAGLSTLYYTGENNQDLAGYSVAPIYSETLNGVSSLVNNRGILVGAPGFAGGSGAAYLIPSFAAGSTTSTGTQSLSAALYRFTVSSSAAGSTPALGTSVSGRLPTPASAATTTTRTGDIFLGAPGFSLTDPVTGTQASRTLDGAEFTVDSLLLTGGNVPPPPPPPPPPNPGNTGAAATTGVTLTSTFLQGSPIFTGLYAGEPYPTVTSLEHLTSYQPLPVQLAYQEFRPAPGFAAREEIYHHPGKGDPHQVPAGTVLGVPKLGRKGENYYTRYNSLPRGVFTRGRFRIGTSTTFTHNPKVIPRSEQTQNFPG